MDINTFPLGVCRQAIMKLDSANIDINEMIEDEDMTEDNREILRNISEYLCVFQAALTNLAAEVMGEEEFLSETLQMDEIDEYPTSDILETEID